MFDDEVYQRHVHFRRHHLAWTALAHFLSADLVRDLCQAVVQEVSDQTLTLEALFEEQVRGSNPVEAWVVRPKEIEGKLAHRLQDVVRTLVWRSDDAQVAFPGDPEEIARRIGPLHAAMQLGVSDFGASPAALERHPVPPGSSLAALRDGLGHLIAGDALNPNDWGRIIGTIDPVVDAPLDAIMLKHFGDLCADSDRWPEARAFYGEVRKRLSSNTNPAWAALIDALGAFTTQSEAAAQRTLEGPEIADQSLRSRLDATGLDGTPLLPLNASFDALVVQLLSEPWAGRSDARASLLLAPQLLESLDLSTALMKSASGRHDDASRDFWKVLRRQIALGSASESRSTKTYFARSLIEGLAASLADQMAPETFRLGVRLAIESGDQKVAATIAWSEDLIARYADAQVVGDAIGHAAKYKGARRERTLVVVEIFKSWIALSPKTDNEIAAEMVGFLASLTASEPRSRKDSTNLHGAALKALKDVARQRPELRALAAPQIATAAPELLSSGGAVDLGEELELLHGYLEAMEPDAARNVLTAVLSLLDGTEPANTAWIVVRPAFNLLLSEAAADFARADAALSRRLVDTVIRYGLAHDNEVDRLLLYLDEFPPEVVQANTSAAELGGAIAKVIEQAKRTNSSAAMPAINALLFAPRTVGEAGVRSAIESLCAVLQTVDQNHGGINFPSAYNAILIIIERRAKVAAALSVSEGTIRDWLKPVGSLVKTVWQKAQSDPLVFAPFALPRHTTPNPTLAHNWAYASIGLAKFLGDEEAMSRALEATADEQPLLREPIGLAKLSRYDSDDELLFDTKAIALQKAETFYATLGKRLMGLPSLDAEHRDRVLVALLAQCLRLGPNGLDLGVLLAAQASNAGLGASALDYDHYVARLENDRKLRLSLGPVLRNMRPSDRR